ncbi:hypothetical protein J5N97_020553 [Dioscorea zingiberensis]|uniref:Uncharacterized protein n=1 Tax=Dioscorea zingiberensis TaxID=325984 RepID=A0A9D5CGM6_9LILI|nr:hypothetical protein J5N97_020553 [Dioscorea zingiberensis]
MGKSCICLYGDAHAVTTLKDCVNLQSKFAAEEMRRVGMQTRQRCTDQKKEEQLERDTLMLPCRKGIVPFVFAREYNLHTEVLSTGVIFGMIISLPITILYYVLLGL